MSSVVIIARDETGYGLGNIKGSQPYREQGGLDAKGGLSVHLVHDLGHPRRIDLGQSVGHQSAQGFPTLGGNIWGALERAGERGRVELAQSLRVSLNAPRNTRYAQRG